MNWHFCLGLAGTVCWATSCSTFLGCQSGESVGAARVSVRASAAADGSHLLTVSLTAPAKSCLEIDRNLLPWKPNIMTLVLVREDAYRSLIEPMHVIADMTPDARMSLNPRQTIRGTINLNQLYPELHSTLHHDNVLVFWNYQLVSRPALKESRFGGWLSLPQQGNNRAAGKASD